MKPDAAPSVGTERLALLKQLAREEISEVERLIRVERYHSDPSQARNAGVVARAALRRAQLLAGLIEDERAAA
jgi:hypothetical protein